MEESFKVEGKPENQQNVDPQNNVSLMFRKLFYVAVSFLKENWQVIIALTFSCMVFTSRNIYTELFSGDSESAIKFTQEYYSNNIYRVVFYFCMYVIFFAGLIISLSCIVSYEDIEEKNIFGQNKDAKKLKYPSIPLRSLQGCVCFTVTAFIIYFLTGMFTFESFRHGFIFYVLFLLFMFALMVGLNFFSIWSIKSAHNYLSSSKNGSKFYKIIIFSISRKSIIYFYASLVFLLIVLLPALSSKSYGYIDVAYRRGYVSCISSENEGFSKTGIPISYDSRGVHIFTGEYYPDESLEYYNGISSEKGYRWRNVHREYLQFEKGYKITSGACKPGSNTSSTQPPPHSRSPQ